jgi:alpha-ketoglutarate-dependent taurine dioxygenase
MALPGHQSVKSTPIRNFRHIQVQPAALALGAYVSGVDLTTPQSEDVYEDIATALWDHHVLFFRNQPLSPAAQVAMARYFGEPEAHELFDSDSAYPELSLLENNASRPPEVNTWHSDVTYRKAPTLCSVLYCLECPEVGGDTMFLNTQLAYETLAPAIRELVDECVLEHDVLNIYRDTDHLQRAGGDSKEAELRAKHPPVNHPAVIAHPVTGKAGLLVNATHGTRFVNMSRLESRHLMSLLCEHQQLPEFQVRFEWSKDSVAMWDNFSTQHYAVADYYPQRRVMRRITVSGHEPVAYSRPEHAKVA